MTDKKVTAKTAGKKSVKAKKPNAFIRFFKKLGKYFSEVVAELKKVTWPTSKDLLKSCLEVAAFVALFAIVVGLVDWGLGALLGLVAGA
ncbi:MAG: preprotein translocase subunit SecE [Christensenellales bacterium]|jgi:preprotein translocase subunit SecE